MDSQPRPASDGTTADRSGRVARDRSRLQGPAVAFGLYLLISFLFFGRQVIDHLDSRTIGVGEDPGLFVWALKWWPHAVFEGWDPLHTQLVYAPQGWDMTWMTGIPGASILLAPLTQTAGPVVAYNVLVLLIPAVNGWAAFLLCRSLGARYWPSLAGGYLFGFSSYVVAQTLGHPNLALVACIPLGFYLVVRRLGGSLSPAAFVAALAATLSFQFLTSTEVFFTLALFSVLVLALALWLLPERRQALWSTAKLALLAYGCTAVVVSPFLVSALSDPTTLRIFPESTDPLNLVIPTQVTGLGGDALDSVSGRFTAGLPEQGAYLGIPLLLIAALFWWERRDRFASILVIAAVVALIAALGSHLTVLGNESVPLPWEPVSHLPVVKYVLPIRLMVYVWLAVAIMAALWLSTGSRGRWVLGVLAIAFVVPNPVLSLSGTFRQPSAVEHSAWDWPRPVPEFFTSTDDRAVLEDRGNVLVLPYHYNADSILWQAEADMSFRMAGGYVSQAFPEEYSCWPIFHDLVAADYRSGRRGQLLAFLRAKGVGAVLAPEGYVSTAEPLLRDLPGEQRSLGGMRVYLLPESFSETPGDACPS